MSDLDTHAKAGIAAINDGRVEDAITSFQQALAIDPARPDLNNSLGMAYLHRGDAGNAVGFFEKAVALSEPFPDSEHAEMKRHFMSGLAMAYQLLDRIDDAGRVFEAMLKRWPDDHETLFQQAVLLLSSCRLTGGVEVLREAADRMTAEHRELADALVGSIEAFVEANSRAALDVIKSENGLNWSQSDINAATSGGASGDLAGLKALGSYAKNQLSQYYWGAGQSKYQASSPDVIKSIRRADDHTGTFDIYITYGDYMGGQLRNVGSGGGRTNAISETTRSTTSPQRSTLRRLSHVVITGIGSTITVAGEPVLESYPFICREIR